MGGVLIVVGGGRHNMTPLIPCSPGVIWGHIFICHLFLRGVAVGPNYHIIYAFAAIQVRLHFSSRPTLYPPLPIEPPNPCHNVVVFRIDMNHPVNIV